MACLSVLNAQTIIMHQNPVADTIRPTFGKGLRHYVHFYGSLGVYLPFYPKQENSALLRSEIKHPNSYVSNIGIRYKLKITKHNAIGIEKHFSVSSFTLKKDATKQVPDTITHTSERLSAFTSGLGLYHRINYGRAGNYIGKFIDAGVMYDFNLSSAHFYMDKMPDGTRKRIWTTAKHYLDPAQLNAFLRFGFNRNVVFIHYRLSPLFKDNTGFSDFAHIAAGFQIGFH